MKEEKKPTVPLETLYEAIRQTPGINYTDLAKMTGVPRGSLDGRLASMERQGYKLTEDEYGRLYAYEKIKISLPWPDRNLTPNARIHWRPKAVLTAEALEAGYWITKADAPYGLFDWTVWKRISAQYTFYPPDRRRRDQDNYAAGMKAYQDGICDAMKINDFHLQLEKPVWQNVFKGGKVILELEKIDDI